MFKIVQEIEVLRQQVGAEQRDIYKKVGATKQTYLNWKQGKSKPQPRFREKLKKIRNQLQKEREIMSNIDIKKMVKETIEKSELVDQLSTHTDVDKEDLEDMSLQELRTFGNMTFETNEEKEEKKERLDRWLDAREKLANGEIDFSTYQKEISE